MIYTATYEPYISIDYSISHPQAPFVRMKESCPTNAGRHYFTTTSATGQHVSIDLCLLTMPFGEKNEELVPYKVDEKNMIWGAQSYSNEVTAYERKLESRFSLPETDDEWLEKEISQRYWHNWKESVKYLGIGLIIFSGIVWAIGWIVRGFLGIPRGLDKKPSNEA